MTSMPARVCQQLDVLLYAKAIKSAVCLQFAASSTKNQECAGGCGVYFLDTL